MLPTFMGAYLRRVCRTISAEQGVYCGYCVMASPPLLTYWHRQAAPLCLLLYILAAVFLSVGWGARHSPVVSLVLPVSGLLMLVLAGSFHHLTVADEGEALAVRFGPLPLFRTAIRYDDIR